MPMNMRAIAAQPAPRPRLKAVPSSKVPGVEDIMAIPLARAGEYELTDKEAQRTRSRIYGINKNNAAGIRFRTMRDGRLLLVWRIR